MLPLSAGFVASALLWWVFAVPTFVKYPTDLDVTPRYEGTFTLFVDRTTAAPLATPLRVPLEIERHIRALDKESGSSRVVVEETIRQTAGDLVDTTQTNVYVMDRRSMQNVADDRAYAFDPSNVVDRSGAYRLNLPFDTSSDSTYTIYKNEIATTYEMRAEHGDADHGERRPAPPQLHRVGKRGANRPGISDRAEQERVAPQVDDARPTQAAAQGRWPRRRRRARGGHAGDHCGRPRHARATRRRSRLRCGTSSPSTAPPVSRRRPAPRSTSSRPSRSASSPCLPTWQRCRRSSPTIPNVPEAVAAGQALAALSSAPATKLFEYHYEQTPASVADIAGEVKSMRNQIRVVELYVPLGLLGSRGRESARWCVRALAPSRSDDRCTHRTRNSEADTSTGAGIEWQPPMSIGTNEEMRTMREASGPPMEPLPVTAHLLQPLIERAAGDPSRPVAAYRDGDRFVDVTASEFFERVRGLAKGLIACGVEEGDRVAFMAHTRLEWLLLDYAILAAGGVTVPDLRNVVGRADAVDTQRQ